MWQRSLIRSLKFAWYEIRRVSASKFGVSYGWEVFIRGLLKSLLCRQKPAKISKAISRILEVLKASTGAFSKPISSYTTCTCCSNMLPYTREFNFSSAPVRCLVVGRGPATPLVAGASPEAPLEAAAEAGLAAAAASEASISARARARFCEPHQKNRT